MFGKGKKKLDRKVRRRIRKTTAVLLLISAITIAALPVSDAAAVGAVALTTEPKAIPDEQKIIYSVAAQKDGKGFIPWIDDKQTIYTSEDNNYKFAYINSKAVLLECNDSAENLTIPGELEAAYMQYAGIGSDGYVAANKEGKPLFYKEVQEIVFKRTVTMPAESGDGSVSTSSSTPDADTVWGGLSLQRSAETYQVYKGGAYPAVAVGKPQQDENNPNLWEQEIKFYVYKYTPCKRGDDTWKASEGSFIKRYVFTQPTTGDDVSKKGHEMTFFRLPSDTDLAKWNIEKTAIQRQLSDYINDDAKEGNGYFAEADSGNDWLEKIEVAYISNQIVTTDAEGIWRADQEKTRDSARDRITAPSFLKENNKTLKIPESLIAIADYSFSGKSSLTEVYFSDAKSLRIGNEVFQNCSNLTSANLSGNLEQMGWYNFKDCSKLTKAVLGSARSIKFQFNNFQGCSALESIEVLGGSATFDDNKELAYNVEDFKKEVAKNFRFIGESSKVPIAKVASDNSIWIQYKNGDAEQNNPSSAPAPTPEPTPNATLNPTPTPSAGNSGASNTDNSASNNNASKARYTLTVANGSGSGSYAEGATVTVVAYTPNVGYEFSNWTSTESDTEFAEKTKTTTSFKMPNKNLTVTANYNTKSATDNSITSKLTFGTTTSSVSSNTGTVSQTNANTTSSSSNNSNNSSNTSTNTSSNAGANNSNNNAINNSGSSVQVSKPGISNDAIASATVNGSTDNFVIKVTEDAQTAMTVSKALGKEFESLENIRYFAMDISLYDETGENKVTDTSGLSVTITLPVPDELRQYGGNNKVGAVSASGDLEKLTTRFTTINGVPCAVFTATHFSPYVLYVDTANLSEGGFDTTPKTGDAIHPKWFLALGLALLSAVLFLKKDKKTYSEMA